MISELIKKKLATAALICSMAYLPIHANAWGMIGHRVVGEIADSYINAKRVKLFRQFWDRKVLPCLPIGAILLNQTQLTITCTTGIS